VPPQARIGAEAVASVLNGNYESSSYHGHLAMRGGLADAESAERYATNVLISRLRPQIGVLSPAALRFLDDLHKSINDGGIPSPQALVQAAKNGD
jgi:hypothetical protein